MYNSLNSKHRWTYMITLIKVVFSLVLAPSSCPPRTTSDISYVKPYLYKCHDLAS